MDNRDTGQAIPMSQSSQISKTAQPQVQTARTVGATSSSQAGEVVINVYPLHADHDKLNAFCKRYLPDRELPDDCAFEVWGNYVYLTVLNYHSVRRFEPREVAFSIPVQWKRAGYSFNRVLVSPYVFVESDDDAILDREQNGRPTVDAELTVEENQDWPHENALLTLETDVLPEGGSRGPIAKKILLQIQNGDRKQPGNSESVSAKKEIREKGPKADAPVSDEVLAIAKVLTLEILVSGSPQVRETILGAGGSGESIAPRPVKSLTIREFRDAENINSPCYQEVLLTRRVISQFSGEIKEFDNKTQVRIGRYVSSYNIVLDLALQGDHPEASFPNRAVEWDLFSPMRPFQIKVSLQEPVRPRSDIYWQSEGNGWRYNPRYDGPDGVTADNPRAILGLGILQYLQNAGSDITERVSFWLGKNPPLQEKETLDQTKLDEVPDPFAIIVSILDDERWGQGGSDPTTAA